MGVRGAHSRSAPTRERHFAAANAPPLGANDTVPGTAVKVTGNETAMVAMRRLLLAVLLLGISGTCAELLLLEHTDGFWQLAPVCLLVGSLVVLSWHGMRRGATSLRAFQATMVLFVVSGFVGLGQHFTSNMEFELEMHPTAEGFGLAWDALKGATPALAPGTMIQLGLLGLLYAYRHPALDVSAAPTSNEDGGIR